MITKKICELFVLNLNKLKEEISLYKNESDLWKIEKEIKNSAGNLTLHLIGNLNHFIGAILGNTGYVRQRDMEFSEKNIPREKLLTDIDQVIKIIEKVFGQMKDEEFTKPYPIDFLGKRPILIEMFLQLLTHLNYHLGQINYHRRILG